MSKTWFEHELERVKDTPDYQAAVKDLLVGEVEALARKVERERIIRENCSLCRRGEKLIRVQNKMSTASRFHWVHGYINCPVSATHERVYQEQRG